MQSRRDILKKAAVAAVANLFEVAPAASSVVEEVSEEVADIFKLRVGIFFSGVEANYVIDLSAEKFLSLKAGELLTPFQLQVVKATARPDTDRFDSLLRKRERLSWCKVSRQQAVRLISKMDKDSLACVKEYKELHGFTDEDFAIIYKKMRMLLSLSKSELEAYLVLENENYSALSDVARKFCELNDIDFNSDYEKSDFTIKKTVSFMSFPDNASAAKVLRGATLPENTFVIINDKKHSNEPPKNWADRIRESRDLESSSCELEF